MSPTSTFSEVISPSELLVATSIPHLRRLNVMANEDEIVISGNVPSYYLKQLAQEAVRPVLGVRRLVNQVQVVEENL